jgi:hypothetical protein
MKKRTYLFSTMVSLTLMFILAGCATSGNWGKLRAEYRHGDMTIQKLVDNWQDYKILYAGLSVKSPAAIMFDPKEDDKIVLGDKWMEVKTKKDVSDIVMWLRAETGFPSALYRILGPNDELFGYVYTGQFENIHIKVDDAKTLRLMELMLPPGFQAPGWGL